MQKRNRMIQTALVMAALTFVACAPAKRGRTGSAQAFASAPVDIMIDNNNWEPVTVYITRGAARYRLALVEGKTTETVRVPAYMIGNGINMRLVAESRVSRDSLTTESFDVFDVRRVSLRIGAQFRMSWFSVY